MSDVYRDRLRAGLRRNSLVLAILTLTALGIGLIATTQAQAAPVVPAATSSPLPPTWTSTPPNTSPFPPGAPTGLTAVAHTNSVTLSWIASTRGCCTVTGYTLTYVQAFNDVVYQTELGNVTTTTITNIIRPATQYQFSVRAHDDLGHLSATVGITVVTPASDTASDQTPPSTPTNLTASNLTPRTVDLAWSGSTDNVGVSGYNIYRFDGLYISTLVATTTSTSYTTPLIGGTNWFYVRARDAAGNVSIASNPVTVLGSTGGPSSGTASSSVSPTASRSASPTVSPSAQSSAPGLVCKVTYRNTSQWHGGFVAGITLANTGAARINGWVLVFRFGGDQVITSTWNAATSQDEGLVALRNLSWNTVIPAGGSVSVGFQGTWTTSNAAPGSFTLNGVPCAVG